MTSILRGFSLLPKYTKLPAGKPTFLERFALRFFLVVIGGIFLLIYNYFIKILVINILSRYFKVKV